jgi:hypothetical protein
LNHAPFAPAYSYSTDEDTPLNVSAPGVLTNDTDLDGDTLHAVLDSGPSHAAVNGFTLNADGSFSYTPAANYNGPDSFTYHANDGTADSNTVTVTLTVNPVDDPPVAVDDSATVLEDASATTIDVLANDTDIDGGPKTIVSKTNGANGATVTITNSGADLTYQPAANFCGADSFTYTLNGGSTATVDVTVTCVNDPPSFTKGADQTNKPNQDSNGVGITYTVSGWATNISAGPANESGQTLTFHVSNDNNGLFTTQPAVDPSSGDLTFTTDPTKSGSATVSVYLTDDGGTANGGNDTSATQTFTISTVFPPPIAVDDSYTATGNVRINVNNASEGVLQRGTDDTLFGGSLHGFGATAGTADGTAPNGSNAVTTSNGGTVVLAADGTFTYNPPAGYTGASDSFYYDLHNAGGDDVGQVTITISNMIWFFDASNASAGDGRLSNPFKAISSFVNDGTGNHGKDGQTLFISNGTYSDPLTLRNSQILIGKGAGASIEAISGITLAPFSDSLPPTGGTRPTLTTSSGNAITLGSGNTIRGLNIGNTAGSGIAGTNFGTLALSEVDITGSGQALNLNNGTANATFGTLSSSSGTNGINLTSVSGSPSATGGSLSGATGDELTISSGGGSFTYPGTITKTGTGTAVSIASKSGGTIALSGQITDTSGSGSGISLTTNPSTAINLTGGVQLSTGANAAFTATGGGTVNVTGASNTIDTTSGKGLDLQNTNAGGSDITFAHVLSTSGQVANIVTSTGTKTLGRISTSSGATTALNLSSAGTVNVGDASNAGSLTTSSAAALVINATTLNLSGLGLNVTTTGGGTGVSDTGGTVAITGGNLGITTSAGSGSGFVATSGGTVSLTGSANTISSGTGPALNVATTIGANDLNFRSISSNGASSGIILANTGSSGGLTVTGNGGSCTPGTPTCTGGTIQNTTSHGISLTNVQGGVSLTRMNIHDTAYHGIFGDGVNGFSFIDSLIKNFGNTTHGTGEDAMHFESTNTANTASGHGLTGTVVIQRDTIGPDGHFVLTPNPPAPQNKGIVIRNHNDAQLTMTVTGTTFTQISDDGIDAETSWNSGSAPSPYASKLNVDGSTADGANTFSQINGRAITFSGPADNSTLETLELTIKNNTFSQVGIGGRWDASARTTVNARYTNNTMSSTSNDAIRSIADATDGSLTPHATTNATITGNNFGGGSAFIQLHRNAIGNEAFSNNTNIGPIGGIFVGSDRASSMGIDVLNNTATVNGNAGQNGLYLQTSNNGGGNSTICANISGNTLTENPNNTGFSNPLVLDTVTNQGTINLEGWTGSPAYDAFLESTNTLVSNNGSVAGAIADNPANITHTGANCVTSTP